MNICSAPNCSNSITNKKSALCNKHYRRLRKFGVLEPIFRVQGPPSKRSHLIDEGKSYCSRCKDIKDLREFYRDINNRLGYSSKCISCLKELRKYYVLHNKRIIKNRQLKYTYNISIETYEAMLIEQNNQCAICTKSNTSWNNRKLAIDHNHQSGKIRGLLCDSCNTGLGLLSDDIETLKNAIEYLQKYEDQIA